MALIIPKNNADAQTLDATLRIYYEANDWVQNSVLIDKLSSALDDLGIEEEKKEPQSYTKKTQVLAYFGFITWQDVTNSQTPRRITELGKRFYEARLSDDTDTAIAVLIESLSTCTFGRNVIGCDSDSDIEAPNVFIKASLLLKGLTNNEFAFILGRMELHGEEFHDAVLKLKVNRIKGIKTYPEENAKKWNDPKPITALKNWGFFNSDDNTISDKVFIKYADALLQLRTKNTEEVRFVSEAIEPDKESQHYLQQIYYGAPGTGKSHEINRLTEGEEVIRTTFHPDSDYSTFVGCYKPQMEEVDMTTVIGETLKVVKDVTGQPKTEKRIVYKYSCQAFLQAYIAAWQHPDKAQYLVIEEINRGNCAQIFGDIFQLLDRNNEGYSSYPIKTDADAEDELRAMFTKEWNLTEEKGKEIEDLYRKHYPDGITKSIKGGSILLLPSNLYIWATMNTSDQSLFPIDSAFKRRWDWKYVKIAEGRDSETKELLNWVVKFDYEEEGKSYTFECSWWQFILAINEKIANATSSDDKKLGYFFCKPKTQDSKEIDAERFVGKVVFYLWNDVLKDEDNAIFKVVEGKGDPSFDTFYTEDDNGKTIADTKALRVFMHNVFGEQSELYTETAKGTKDTAETVTE